VQWSGFRYPELRAIYEIFKYLLLQIIKIPRYCRSLYRSEVPVPPSDITGNTHLGDRKWSATSSRPSRSHAILCVPAERNSCSLGYADLLVRYRRNGMVLPSGWPDQAPALSRYLESDSRTLASA
jgi:hypothetical protein